MSTPKSTTKRNAKEETRVPAIKGMGMGMSCLGHKFEVGQTYGVTGKIRACENGFHSCPVDDEHSPLSVFEYYAPGTSRYFEVEAHGETHRDGSGGAAFSHAYGGKVMCGGDGQALYCTEFADDGSIKSVACGITGKDGIEAGRWYAAKDGRLVAL